MKEPVRRPHDGVKRVLDIAGAGLGLIVTAPIMAVVAVMVAAKLGRPVVFTQERPGKDGRVFRLYKFRTMKNVDELRGLVSDEQRLTDFGRRLRSTSLDELPTLVNVLKGDMSVVGPRPLLVRYLDRYSPEQARRHEVRPGITGLAQVIGRNALTWDEKFAADIEYVQRRGLLLDLSILCWTIFAVTQQRGISGEGEATMSEFVGSRDDAEPTGVRDLSISPESRSASRGRSTNERKE